MKLDKALNLVIPIYSADETTVRAYVHSTPIARDVFEKYFLEISQTFSAIYSQGIGMVAGPRVAKMLLERKARENGTWDGAEGVKAGLIEEIRRLTAVIVKDGAVWQPIPLGVAVDRGVIDADDMAEVENAIVFFIVASAMHRRSERQAILQGSVDLWGAQISSSTSTEFANSLRTSTATGNSGEKPPATAPAPSGPANAVVDGKPSQLPV